MRSEVPEFQSRAGDFSFLLIFNCLQDGEFDLAVQIVFAVLFLAQLQANLALDATVKAALFGGCAIHAIHGGGCLAQGGFIGRNS